MQILRLNEIVTAPGFGARVQAESIEQHGTNRNIAEFVQSPGGFAEMKIVALKHGMKR